MVPQSRPRPGQRSVADRRAGFSLIELLTVIAIIAILAAVVFPVANTVRIRAQHTQLINNMKSIQAALGIYKQDERGYPPSLGQVMIGQGTQVTYNHLFGEYVKGREGYESPNNPVENPEDKYPVDLAASISGGFIAPPDPRDPSGFARRNPVYQIGATISGWNTMDGSVSPTTGKYILHYSRYRTWDKNDKDYKRQLGFRNPPEDTVVTWNDTFVNYESDPPKGDLFVLFLSGTVKKFSMKDKRVTDVNGQYWRLKPY